MLFVLLSLGLGGPEPVVVRPPTIAIAVGMTVGLTTVARFERQYGKGTASTGGHAAGARSWYDKTTHALIYADGFNLSAGGEVIEDLRVRWVPVDSVSRGIPRITLPKSSLGWAAKLRSGMTPAQVASVLHTGFGPVLDGKHEDPRTVRRTGLIQYSRRLINKDNERYTEWRLSLSFGPQGLDQFTVTAD